MRLPSFHKPRLRSGVSAERGGRRFSGIATLRRAAATAHRRSASGSVLIIVLWIAFGLVSLSLYFANSMTFELRASDNRVASQSAEQAIEGAARYITYLLSNMAANGSNGILPDVTTYAHEAVSVGDAHFWLIGRDTNLVLAGPGQLSFGLIAEASRLNLNTVKSNQMIWLPRMTEELAGAILDWRDTNATGPTVTYYAMQQPPYLCKSDRFETVDELRLVYGADMDILVGEDVNRNGILDPNENDENQNNMLDPGALEYFTAFSKEPNSGGVNVSTLNATSLSSLLSTNFSTDRANQILTSLGLGMGGGGGQRSPATNSVSFTSVLQFYERSGMTMSEFEQVATNFTVATTTTIEGRVNVNTASLAVLTCLLGGDTSAAQQLINYRSSNPYSLTSVAWVKEALSGNYPEALTALEAGDYITTRTYQFTADVAALGPYGRGYKRVKFVFDTSSGTPQIIYRQDLTHLGWALGKEVRQNYVLSSNRKS